VNHSPRRTVLEVYVTVQAAVVVGLVLALFLAAGQGFRPLVQAAQERTLDFPANLATAVLVLVVAVIPLYTVVPAVAVLWACLCLPRPAPRLVLALLMVLAIAAFPLHVLGGPAHLRWAAVTILHAALVAASLLFFRRLGYRWIAPDSGLSHVLRQDGLRAGGQQAGPEKPPTMAIETLLAHVG